MDALTRRHTAVTLNMVLVKPDCYKSKNTSIKSINKTQLMRKNADVLRAGSQSVSPERL